MTNFRKRAKTFHRTVKVLLEKGLASIEDPGPNDRTALLCACMKKKNLENIKFLRKKGANVGRSNRDMESTVTLAASFGDLEMVKYFLEKFSVESRGYEGKTVLLCACTNVGNLEMVKYLVETKRANINAVDSDKNCVLSVCAEYGDADMLEYLLRKDAKVTVRSNILVDLRARFIGQF